MKKRNFLFGIMIIMLAGALLVACQKDAYNKNNSGSNNTPTIYMKNSVFSNTNLQVASGTKVVWNNDDTTVHTVTADDNSFDSGDIEPGGTYSQTFSSAGTFAYHCKHHTEMTGVVVVVMSNSY